MWLAQFCHIVKGELGGNHDRQPAAQPIEQSIRSSAGKRRRSTHTHSPNAHARADAVGTTVRITHALRLCR